MPSPLCEVKDGAGAYAATTNGVDVTPGNTVTIHLIDTSADTWSIECVYTDETSDAETVTAGLTIDSNARTATFTAPAAGKAYIFRSRVNNGMGPNGPVSSYTTTFGIFTKINGDRVMAVNETTEGDSTFGWVSKFNAMVRNGGASFETDNGSIEVFAAEKGAPTTASVDIVTGLSLPDDAHSVIDVQASFRGAAGSKLFNERIEFFNAGGAFTDGTQTPLITPSTLATAPGATLTITRSGSAAKISGSGAVGGWRVDGQIVRNAVPSGVAPGSVPSAPTAISPSSGSTAGGTAVTITVPDSTGLTGAKVGGVPLTGFAIDDATHVSGTTGAHAAGAVDVVVSNAYGDSAALAGAFTYSAATFDPATLALSAWWKADYSTSPWTSAASAGASSGRTASEATNPPSTGATVNGKVPADFDGVNDKLSTTVLESDLFTAAAGSLAILYYADTTDAAASPVVDDEAMFAGVGGYVAANVNNTGARAVLYDTGYKSIQLTSGTSGGWHLFQMKWDGTNLKARIDSDTWSSTACGNMGDLTSTLNIGANYNATAFFDGRILEVITAAATLSDSNFDDLVSYCNARYGLAL